MKPGGTRDDKTTEIRGGGRRGGRRGSREGGRRHGEGRGIGDFMR